MSYCIIISDHKPHRFYATKQRARDAAKRLAKRTGITIEVVWCNDQSNPKLWLAMVDPNGAVTYDEHWTLIDTPA